ncbi:3-phosphoshikimate 1-carboxyvinyltransferase [Paraglaciecola sp.]|uniref:3-phosphoshikimate 1-carboxyvinyltransferase n=1 Tax=Paraglaciecola sp. TaxID=1920173 RepID=UPI003267C9F9
MAKSSNIKEEAAIKKLISRMPNSVANSFTEDQLLHLKIALGARKWGKHKIDIRGTFPFPFVRSKIYYVFLIGKNHRELSRNEKAVSAFTFTLLSSIFILFCILLGLLILYLIKSALGINLFENFSLGIWSWFKSVFR